MPDFSHKDLCKLAVDWLKRPASRNGPGCLVAVSETQNYLSNEVPDAIGWRPLCHGGAGSTVVEVKVSRADFLADRQKPHRMDPAIGMGAYRYYLAPEGVIRQEDLPARWGLIEVTKRGSIKVRCGHVLLNWIRKDEDVWRHEIYNHPAEISMLARVLARVGDPQQLQESLRDYQSRMNRMAAANDKLMKENRELSRNLYVLRNGPHDGKAVARRISSATPEIEESR